MLMVRPYVYSKEAINLEDGITMIIGCSHCTPLTHGTTSHSSLRIRQCILTAQCIAVRISVSHVPSEHMMNGNVMANRVPAT